VAESINLATALAGLPAKEKQPASARILTDWITQADNKLVPGGTSGRLRWLVASTVVTGALQRAVDGDGRALFLAKGGTLIQYRLGLAARATSDLDGLVRGDLEAFLDKLEATFAEPWGPLELSRGAVEVINVPARAIKPRRFDVKMALRGKPWARVQVEIAPDEAGAGATSEPVAPPHLAAFGLPEPATMAGLAMRFQISQKLHAATDPHDPPALVNDRSRDLIDLVLLTDLAERTGAPTLAELRQAAVALFDARAAEARAVDWPARSWPPSLTPWPHWAQGYRAAAEEVGLGLGIEEATALVNSWIAEIDAIW
jgi:hypothetical protein